MIKAVSLLRGVGNKVYDHAFPIYRLCYRTFKAYADKAERQLLRRILSAGDVVVDAGANIGIYSQFLARCIGATGIVHPFELPVPQFLYRLLFPIDLALSRRLPRLSAAFMTVTLTRR